MSYKSSATVTIVSLYGSAKQTNNWLTLDSIKQSTMISTNREMFIFHHLNSVTQCTGDWILQPLLVINNKRSIGMLFLNEEII